MHLDSAPIVSPDDPDTLQYNKYRSFFAETATITFTRRGRSRRYNYNHRENRTGFQTVPKIGMNKICKALALMLKEEEKK